MKKMRHGDMCPSMLMVSNIFIQIFSTAAAAIISLSQGDAVRQTSLTRQLLSRHETLRHIKQSTVSIRFVTSGSGKISISFRRSHLWTNEIDTINFIQQDCVCTILWRRPMCISKKILNVHGFCWLDQISCSHSSRIVSRQTFLQTRMMKMLIET